MNAATKNIIFRISILLGLALFVFLVVNAIIHRKSTLIKKTEITIDDLDGNFMLDKKQISALLNKNFEIKNNKLNGNDLEEIEDTIAALPLVKKANAYIDNNGNLNIQVEQRRPLLRVFNSINETYYVDEEGIKFPCSKLYTAKVPVVNGNIPEQCGIEQKIQSKELKRVFAVWNGIKENDTWKNLIGQLFVNQKSELELVPRIGSAIIYFGNDQDIPQKIKRMDVFYFEVLPKVGWNTYKVINIMYKDQVICKK